MCDANCCNYPSFHFTCLFPGKFVSWHIANFSTYLLTAGSMSVKHNVLNVNSLVGTFNQEKAPFSVIMNLRVDLRLKL